MEALTLYLLQQAPWKIITLGAITLVAAGVLITLAAAIGYAFLPVWVAVILHLAALVGAGYYLGTFFARVYILRRFINVIAVHLADDDG